MSEYLTPRTVFVNTKFFAELCVLLCSHSARWESCDIASLGYYLSSRNITTICRINFIQYHKFT